VKLVIADFVLTCNATFEIIEKGGVVFDETIIDIGPSDVLQAKYPDAELRSMPPHSVILPGLINSHVHLEFSANRTMLRYGDFIPWLRSVIQHREELGALATHEHIAAALREMLHGGTTTLGAISSFGADLDACVQTPQRVVYFNEVLGSVASAADAMYGDFAGRYEGSKAFASDRFIPAISVHSPYSTHPILAKKALLKAREERCVVSTHFMESLAERAWLDHAEGDFQPFLSAFNPHAKPMCDALEYLALFENVPTLFTHAVHADSEELHALADQKATLTHCPVSNRLLGSGKLDVAKVVAAKINFTLGTDGLSSNISLSLWDEMRSALMMHCERDLNALAKLLLQSVTCNAAHALKLPCGILEKERYADLIVATLPQACDQEALIVQTLLHTRRMEAIYIHGEALC